MMAVEKEKNKLVFGKTRWLAFDGFSLFPTKDKNKLVASESINCSCLDGTLGGGIGYTRYVDRLGNFVKTPPLQNPHAVYALETWAKDGVLVYYFVFDGDGQFYQYIPKYDGYLSEMYFDETLGVSVAAAIAPNGDTSVVVSGQGGVFCVNGETWQPLTEIAGENGTDALCFTQNRIFLGEKPCKVWYSDPETPWDFTQSYDDGGYVQLPLDKGDIVGIKPLGDTVYVFFERGIAALTPDGLARNFKLRDVPYSAGEIFAGSMGVCGNYLFFLSENGICRFDGKNVQKVGAFLGVNPKRGGQVCVHACVGEYFVLRYQEDDSFCVRTVALRADGEDGYFISEYAGLNECDRQPLCVVDGYICKLVNGGELPRGESRTFTSKIVDLTDKIGGNGGGFDVRGYVGAKAHLKTVTLFGEGCFRFEIHDGKDWRGWDIEDLPQKLTINVGSVSEAFRFRFILEKDAKISRMLLQTETA